MHARVISGAILGVDAYLVSVEADLSGGLQFFQTVGLPEGAVRESRVRVRSALGNAGFHLPQMRITVNLGPADIRKEGAAFDVPMAIGILAAWGRIGRDKLGSYLLAGELGLDGEIRPLRGALSIAQAARDGGLKGLIVPKENAGEAALVEGVEVRHAQSLSEVISFMRGTMELPLARPRPAPAFQDPDLDLSQVRGQEHVKRAMEVAAAGGHNCLLVGPPGSGKTMLARRLPTILPPMSLEEALETTKVYSVLGHGVSEGGLVAKRPFRSPHHTISDVGLIGGGRFPMPGEVSMAHNGVLFLDELPEFKRNALEVLRQPLEEGSVTITRSMTTVRFPARIMLIAAMNPCPCGMALSPAGLCSCTPPQIHLYRSRISGPLLDRVDLHMDVPSVPIQELSHEPSGESSEQVRGRVTRARRVQEMRFKGLPIHCNAQMGSRQIAAFCRLSREGASLLNSSMERLGLSARAYSRICKVARTIADLEGEEAMSCEHLAEAIQYRRLDQKGGLAAA